MSETVNFKKSSFCHTEKCCVEVAQDGLGNVLVRHTDDAEKTLRFTPKEWEAFVQGVKQNEFDVGQEAK